jgi:hypothetical protein
MRRAARKASALGAKAAAQWQKDNPGKAYEWGRLGAHIQNHVRRHIYNPKCSLCAAAGREKIEAATIAA